jgi:competence protein ComEC
MLIIAPHRLSGSPIKAWAMAGGMMVAGAYTLLSGTEVPAQRAWTVVGLGTAALWYRRLTLPRYVWNIIGTILWLTNPMLIASVPAQLSFLATLGVIATSGRGPLRTTFGATFATLPVILNTFHGLSPYTLLANLFAIPWLSMAVIPLLLGTLLWPAWSACGVEIIYAHLLTAALDMLLLWADRLAHWPLADVYVPKPPLVTILCLTGSVLWWGLVSGAARRWHWIMLICSAITWWACLPTEWTIQTEHGPIYARKSTDGALEISSLADPQITQHFLAVSGLTSARQKVPWVNSRKKCPH